MMLLSIIISVRQIAMSSDLKLSVGQVFLCLHLWKQVLTKSSSAVTMAGKNPGENN